MKEIDSVGDYAFALSWFGLSHEDFLDLTPRELLVSIRVRVLNEKTVAQSISWPITSSLRMAALKIRGALLGKSAEKDPKKLWDLPQDEEVKKYNKPQTLQEMKRILKTIAASDPARKKQRKKLSGKKPPKEKRLRNVND